MKHLTLLFSLVFLLLSALQAQGVGSWLTQGNDRIEAENRNHFFGTRNQQPIVFKTNNEERMRIFAEGQIIFLTNTTFRSNMELDGSLLVTQNTEVNGNLDLGGNATIAGSTVIEQQLTVNDDTEIAANLNVREDVLIGGNTFVSQNLTVDFNTAIGADLEVANNANIGNITNIGNDLNVGQNTAIENDLNVGNNATIDVDLSLGNDATIGNNTSIGKDLNVGQNTAIENDLNVGNNATIDVDLNLGNDANIGNNTSIGKDLNVGNNATIDGELIIRKHATIDSNLTLGNNATINNDLVVRQDAIVDSNLTVSKNTNLEGLLIVNQASILDSLNVRSGARFDQTVAIKDRATINSLTVENGAAINGKLTAKNDLTVAGGVSIGDTLVTNGNATFKGTMEVRDAALFQGQMAIGQASTNTAFNLEVDDSFDFPFVLKIDSGDENDVRRFSMENTGQIHLRNNISAEGFDFDEFFKEQDAPELYAMKLQARSQGMYVMLDELEEMPEDATAEDYNFITFGNSSEVEPVIYGGIEATGTADNPGVTLQSGAADYAEWLPKRDANEELAAGDIVGVTGGQVSKKTTGAAQMMVISSAPLILGNMPSRSARADFEKAAFMGQVPVRVLGPVAVGDYILPSGQQDGTGVAIAPQAMQLQQYAQIVGVAWESSAQAEEKLINTAIGLNQQDLLRVITEQQATLDRLQADMDMIKKQLGLAPQATTSPSLSQDRD